MKNWVTRTGMDLLDYMIGMHFLNLVRKIEVCSSKDRWTMKFSGAWKVLQLFIQGVWYINKFKIKGVMVGLKCNKEVHISNIRLNTFTAQNHLGRFVELSAWSRAVTGLTRPNSAGCKSLIHFTNKIIIYTSNNPMKHYSYCGVTILNIMNSCINKMFVESALAG